MSNKKILIGMLVVVLAFGIIGCKEPGAPHELAKTKWTLDGNPNLSFEFKDNGEYELIIDKDAWAPNIRGLRGTYSIKDDVITYTVKEIWLGLNDDFEEDFADWFDVWALGMKYGDKWGYFPSDASGDPTNQRGADYDRLNNLIRDMFKGLYEDWLDAYIADELENVYDDDEDAFLIGEGFNPIYGDDMDYFKDVMMGRYDHAPLGLRLMSPLVGADAVREHFYFPLAKALEDNAIPGLPGFRTTSRLSFKWEYELVDDIVVDGKMTYKEDKNVLMLRQQATSSPATYGPASSALKFIRD